jgi:hypothetical protein
MALIDNRGNQVPFFVEDFTLENITNDDFDPITLLTDSAHVPGSLNASQVGRYTKAGFLVRPNADGYVYGITWRQWLDNGKSFVGLMPQGFLGLASTWVEVPYVKIYASDDGTFPTVATSINVAPISH